MFVSNSSIENRLSKFDKRRSSKISHWEIWARWGFPTVSSSLASAAGRDAQVGDHGPGEGVEGEVLWKAIACFNIEIKVHKSLQALVSFMVQDRGLRARSSVDSFQLRGAPPNMSAFLLHKPAVWPFYVLTSCHFTGSTLWGSDVQRGAIPPPKKTLATFREIEPERVLVCESLVCKMAVYTYIYIYREREI